jgi:hypothetical protein
MGKTIKFPECIYCYKEIPYAKHSNRHICKECERIRKNESTKRWTERKKLERTGA